jgi:hypothetical protein
VKQLNNNIFYLTDFLTNSLGGSGRTILQFNQVIASNNKCFQLVMQTDGNLVLYKQSTGRALWSSGTYNVGASKTVMQGDGNLVVYNSVDQPKWNSRTNGNTGAFLILQDDGNLVIYSATARSLWSSNTMTSCQ